jgi:hypothetical protein
VAAARALWKANQPLLDPARLVFIGEPGTSTNMARLRSRSKRWQRLIFRTYLERCLVPTLNPGGIVVMDNLSSHKSQRVRQIIEDAGAKLIAPLHAAAERAIPALWDRIGSILDSFPSGQCQNFFRHAGMRNLKPKRL